MPCSWKSWNSTKINYTGTCKLQAKISKQRELYQLSEQSMFWYRSEHTLLFSYLEIVYLSFYKSDKKISHQLHRYCLLHLYTFQRACILTPEQWNCLLVTVLKHTVHTSFLVFKTTCFSLDKHPQLTLMLRTQRQHGIMLLCPSLPQIPRKGTLQKGLEEMELRKTGTQATLCSGLQMQQCTRSKLTSGDSKAKKPHKCTAIWAVSYADRTTRKRHRTIIIHIK